MKSYFKELRKNENITQEEMSKKLSISYSHYTKLETGFVNPSFKLLKKVKQVFINADINKFFE